MRGVTLAAIACCLACDPPSATVATGGSGDRLGVWVPDRGATLVSVSRSGLVVPTYTVVSDQESWRALWSLVWRDSVPPPSLPAIDFVLAAVVVASPGQGGGEGTVSIDSIVTYVAGAIGYVSEVRAGPTCPGGSVLAAPVHMAVVLDHPPVVRWDVRTSLAVCP